MAKLLISTQVYENYGSADQPYWKAKGGEDYVVPNFTLLNNAKEFVDQVRDRIESDDKFYREHIVCWSVVEDDYLTPFERSQLDWEGRILYPARQLDLA